MIAETATDQDALAAMEEGLRYGVLGGVIGEIDRLDLTASRRLQLASEKAGLMTWSCAGLQTARNPAKPHRRASRWRIAAAPSTAQAFMPRNFSMSPNAPDGRWNSCAPAMERQDHGLWKPPMRRVICIFLPHWPIEARRGG